MDWRSIVSAVAPVIGAALGGPLGGMAMSTVAKAVTGNEAASEKDIIKAMTSMSPDALTKLREAENAFVVRMRELDIDVMKISASNTADARKAMTDNGSFDKLFALGLAVTIIAIAAECYAGFAELPEGVDKTLTGRVLGTLDALTMTFWTFNYGSSSGSKAKNEMIYNSTPIK